MRKYNFFNKKNGGIINMILKRYLQHFMGIPTNLLNLIQKIKELKERIPTNTSFMVGKYRFTNYINLPGGRTVILSEGDWEHNLIVTGGRVNFLNRLKDNAQTYIQGMGVGTGTAQPALGNTTLTSEVRKAILSATVNTTELTTTFRSQFTAAELSNKTEIGLFTSPTAGQGTMISRGVHSAISMPGGSLMNVDYVLSLQTGVIASNWTLSSGQTKTFEVAWGSPVLSVVESDTGNGYVKETSIATVEATANTWYYDSGAGKLYVHSSNDTDPDTHVLMVLSAAS
jgi:hypothetical protein